MHPKKSLIFQGTRFVPLPYKGGGRIFLEEGRQPLLDTPENRELKRSEAPMGGWKARHRLKGGWGLESFRGEASNGWEGGKKEISLIFISISGLISRIEEWIDGRLEFTG